MTPSGSTNPRRAAITSSEVLSIAQLRARRSRLGVVGQDDLERQRRKDVALAGGIDPVGGQAERRRQVRMVDGHQHQPGGADMLGGEILRGGRRRDAADQDQRRAGCAERRGRRRGRQRYRGNAGGRPGDRAQRRGRRRDDDRQPGHVGGRVGDRTPRRDRRRRDRGQPGDERGRIGDGAQRGDGRRRRHDRPARNLDRRRRRSAGCRDGGRRGDQRRRRFLAEVDDLIGDLQGAAALAAPERSCVVPLSSAAASRARRSRSTRRRCRTG